MSLATEVLLILLFSILGGIIAAKFRQPSVLGVLVIGAITGPNAIGLISNTSMMDIAIEIGAILLLFLVGLEFSTQKLLNMGLRALVISVIKMGTVFFLAYSASLLLGLDALSALFMGVILSITSTAIFLKILQQNDLSRRREVSLLIAVLIIEDIFAVFALTFFSGLASKGQITIIIIMIRLIVSLSLLVFVYLLIRKVSQPLADYFSKYSTEETITFKAIAICGFMAYLAHLLGLSTAVGAFLAGNIVSSLRNAEAFEKAIHPFILTFSTLFFFSIGTLVDFAAIAGYIWVILVLFAVNLVAKFFSVGFSTYVFSDEYGKGAVFSGLAMLSVGEFSLLIAKEANVIKPGIDFISITAMIIFLSSLSMSMLVSRSDSIYSMLSFLMPKGLKFDLKEASRYAKSMSTGMVFNEFTRRKISLEWGKIYRNAIGILFILLIVVVWYNTTQFLFIRTLLYADYAKEIIISVVILLILFPTFNIIRNTRDLIIDVFRAVMKLYPSEIANERKVFRNVLIAVNLFIGSLMIPALVSLLGLSPIWSAVSIVLLALLLFVISRADKLIATIQQKNKKLAEFYERKYRDMIRK